MERNELHSVNLTRRQRVTSHDDGGRTSDNGERTVKSDAYIARQARRRPRLLKQWLERVESRFLGTPVDVQPHDAILLALRIAAGEVKYCDAQVTRLSEDELFERPESLIWVESPDGESNLLTEKRNGEVISRWVSLRRDAVDRMARYAKMAIDVGIEEREVNMTLRDAHQVATFFECVMNDIGLSQSQRVKLGPAMRRHITTTMDGSQ